MNPLVSIGMPVFNCQCTLSSAVNSILYQTYSNWELFLIDDGSKDKTSAIAESFSDPRIKVIADGSNQNLPDRLNQAIFMSNGKYFARMDGDDISYPKRLQKQVKYLEKNEHIDLLGTNVLVIDQDDNPRGMFTAKLSHTEICQRPWAGFALCHPTWMGKTDWFRTHKYRPKAVRTEDRDLLFRTYETSQFACLSEILLAYRVQSLSLKKILPARYNASVAILEKAFAEKNYIFALRIFEQLAKAFVDIIAVTTKLEFKLVGHRLGNHVNQEERERLKQVLSQID
ncbi:glycosyltransferase family 2 protein [Acaryochloris marina NIES-2412]|uniref:glycosyltransferase family 2 protein n=1 Tax=Acaryochloris marina TaxID=155978 RepID=UPI0040599EF6